VIDVSFSGLDGLALQQAFDSRGPTSVRAMKAEATDFLTKPVQDQDLL
jgi:FixJ family two-component response regulator